MAQNDDCCSVDYEGTIDDLICKGTRHDCPRYAVLVDENFVPLLSESNMETKYENGLHNAGIPHSPSQISCSHSSDYKDLPVDVSSLTLGENSFSGSQHRKGRRDLSNVIGGSRLQCKGQYQHIGENRYSAEASRNIRNHTQVVKMIKNQSLPSSSNQVWNLKEKIEFSTDLSKKASKVWQSEKKTEPSKVGRVTENTELSKTSSKLSMRVWRAKEKTEPSKDSSKSPLKKHSSRRCSRRNTRKHHISWNGFDDPDDEPPGGDCYLCEKNLAYSPTPSELDSVSYDMPCVSVLPCGHAFHTTCMEISMSEDQLQDPWCFMCAILF